MLILLELQIVIADEGRDEAEGNDGDENSEGTEMIHCSIRLRQSNRLLQKVTLNPTTAEIKVGSYSLKKFKSSNSGTFIIVPLIQLITMLCFTSRTRTLICIAPLFLLPESMSSVVLN